MLGSPLAAVQLTLVSFFVLFLHERLGLPATAAAALLVAAQALGAVGRVGEGEIAGLRRAGAAMGLQNTALYAAGAAVPAIFGFVVDALGWAGALATLSVLALAGWCVLRGLDEPSEGDDISIVKRKTQ